MSFLNIGGDSNDLFYRYKMPVLEIKVEGNRTFLTNLVKLCESLHVQPNLLMQYLSYEIGTQVKIDKKTERIYLNGKKEIKELNVILNNFIELLVLCPKCKKPEIKYKIKKSVKLDCAACGNVHKVESNHKIIGYMLKQTS